MCDLLKLPKQMPRKTCAEGQILFKCVFPICSTMLGISQLCLPMLHLWTVAKTALRQENQMDYKKISGILSNLHHVSRLNQQQTAFQKCLWHLVAEKHKKKQTCALFRPYCGQWYIAWQRWPFALGLVAVLRLVKPWWSASADTSELWPCGRGMKCWRHSESSRSGDKSGRRITGWGGGCPRIKGSLMILLSDSVTSSVLSPALYDILWSFLKGSCVCEHMCGINLEFVHAEYP